MELTVEKLLAIAEAEVGYLEKKTNSSLDDKTTNAGYNNWTKYARDLYKVGYYNGNKNGYAWCDVFVDWCFLQLCEGDAKKAEWIICQTGDYGAGCGYSMRYYKAKGRFSKTPMPGDQIFFGSSESNVAHTGIVYKVDSSYVYTIEGNTSSTAGVVANGGGVFKKSYARNYNRIVGYGHPYYDGMGVLPAEPEDTTLRKGSTGKNVEKLQENLKTLGFYKSTIDGDFGSATDAAVRAFQKDAKITADGVVGPQTLNAIEEALNAQKAEQKTENGGYTLEQFVREVQAAVGTTVDGIAGSVTLSKTKTLSTVINRTHALVRLVQKRLKSLGYYNDTVDGIFGNVTKTAVKAFQKDNQCTQDGVITARNKTWEALLHVDK